MGGVTEVVSPMVQTYDTRITHLGGPAHRHDVKVVGARVLSMERPALLV